MDKLVQLSGVCLGFGLAIVAVFTAINMFLGMTKIGEVIDVEIAKKIIRWLNKNG